MNGREIPNGLFLWYGEEQSGNKQKRSPAVKNEIEAYKSQIFEYHKFKHTEKKENGIKVIEWEQNLSSSSQSVTFSRSFYSIDS